MRIFYLLFVAAILVGNTGCAEESGSSETTDAVATTDAAETPEAVETADAGENPIEQGRLTFQEYCTGCHGDEAMGDGPIAADLRVPPPNLRLLSQENDGVFPAEDVYAFVDGSDIYADHGATREMPVWGNIWEEEDGQPRPEEVVRKEISEVVEYLRSIQE